MTAKEKIRTLVKQYGGTQKAFATLVGITQPTVANWIAADQIPAGGAAKIHSALPDVPLQWLMDDSDAPLPTTQSGDWGDEFGQGRIPGGVSFYASMPCSAGQNFAFEDDRYTEQIVIPGFRVDAYFPVNGSSMEPTLMSGDIIGIRKMDSMESLRPDCIYLVFTSDQERMIKRVENIDPASDTITLVSDNPKHRPFQVMKSQVTAIYRVVNLIRGLE